MMDVAVVNSTSINALFIANVYLSQKCIHRVLKHIFLFLLSFATRSFLLLALIRFLSFTFFFFLLVIFAFIFKVSGGEKNLVFF